MSVATAIFMLPFCFVGYAFFAGMEAGVLRISHARLAHLIRYGSKAAAILNRYLQNTQRFLTTVLIGTNIMSVALSTLSANCARKCFDNSQAGQILWGIGMALLTLTFCEYLPKLFFSTRPLRRTIFVARVFAVVERILTPVTAFIMYLTRWLSPTDEIGEGRRFLISREYFQNVVSDGRDGSRITALERIMINRVLSLHAKNARQIMTPIAQVTHTTTNAVLAEAYQLVQDSGHTRLPVFTEEGVFSNCVGVLDTIDVIGKTHDSDKTLVSSCMQSPFYIYADTRADHVLPLLRRHRKHLAIVRERQTNGVVGIITEENVLFLLTSNLHNVRV